MTPLQQIDCSPEQLSVLANIYADNNLHELRQRGHAVILRHKGYGLDEICSVLGRSKWDILVIIKTFFYFGFDGLNNLDYNDLFSKIKEIEEPETQEDNSRFWVSINSLIGSMIKYLIVFSLGLLIFKGFEFIAKSSHGKYLTLSLLAIPVLFLVWIMRWLTQSLIFDTKKNVSTSNNATRNSLNFIGSSNIINQFIFNLNGEINQLNSLKQFNSAIEKAAISDEEIKSNDYRIDSLIKLAKRYNNIIAVRSLIIVVGGSAVYWSIKYSATVKAGFLIFAWFSVRLTMTVLSEGESVEVQKSNISEKVIISKDSITTSSNPQNREIQYDFSKMPVSYEHEYLIDIGKEATWFIKNDSTDHSVEYYFANQKDDRVYLQVAYYNDIRLAAIQRKNLIENHNFKIDDCQILYTNRFGEQRYGVTICNAPRDNIERLSEMQKEWNEKANSSNVRAYLKTN